MTANNSDMYLQTIDTASNEQILLMNSSYWDEEWYRNTYHIEGNALEHFCTVGWKCGNDPSRYFSTSSYLDLNPDIRASGINPLTHYECFGKNEGRPFVAHKLRTKEQQLIEDSPFWDEKWYLEKYHVTGDALEHFCEIGWKLGYNPSPKFSIAAYVKLNPDVSAANVGNPLIHYETFGRAEFRLFEPVGFPAESETSR